MTEEYGINIYTYRPQCQIDARFIHGIYIDVDGKSGEYGLSYLVLPECTYTGMMVAHFTLEALKALTFQYQIHASSEDLHEGFIVAVEDTEQVDLNATLTDTEMEMIERVVHDIIVPEMQKVREKIITKEQEM